MSYVLAPNVTLVLLKSIVLENRCYNICEISTLSSHCSARRLPKAIIFIRQILELTALPFPNARLILFTSTVSGASGVGSRRLC